MGFTPVDAAGGLIGLANLAAINTFFWAHGLYATAYLISLVVVGMRAATERARPADVFWVGLMNALLIAGFAANGKTATASVAATGSLEVTPQQLTGFTSVPGVPVAFHLIDEGETALAVGVIQLFQQIPGGTKFLEAPFRAQTLANGLALAQIKDPGVRKAFFDFLGDCYSPALARWANDQSGQTLKEQRLLPSKLMAYYPHVPAPAGTGTCLDVWNVVRDKVYDDAVQQGHIDALSRFAEMIGATIFNIRNWMVDALLQNYTAKFGSLEAFGVSILDQHNPSFLGNPLAWVANKGMSWLANYPMVAGLSEAIKGAGPQIASYTLSVIKGMFPFVLVFAVLTLRYGDVLRFFTYLLSVKMWFVGWAMVDAAATMSKKVFYPAGVFAEGYNYSYYDMFATALMYVTVPGLMTYLIAGAANNAGATLNRLSGSLPIGTIFKSGGDR